jgi:hypothetical protein
MGQQVTALIVGVDLGDDLHEKLTDKESGGDFVWDVGKPLLDCRKTPTTSETGDALGFAYAISGGSEDDMATMGEESIPVRRLADAYPKERAKAEKKWRTFAKWVKEHRGVDLPEPEIILTCIEVA